MRIASPASASPKHYYSQKFLMERLQDYWGAQLKNPLLLARLHRNVTVDGGYLAIPTEQYLDIKTWGQANDIWIKVAQEFGEQALCLALHNAGLKPHDLGALLFTTVTGIASPSIDALLINRMGLPANIRRTPIFGLGCVAGAAGIARAADYVRAYPSQAAALVSVELCSLTLQREDLSVANLISSGLFADGAAAVIVAGAEFESSDPEISGPKILATRSVFYPGTEEMMGLEHFRERLPHRAVDRGSESDSPKPRAGRRRFSGGQRIPAKRPSKLGSTHRRTEGARGLGYSTGVTQWTVGCLLGLPA
jgi:alkylresorcinol/alkylpyrone synthase